MIFGMRYSPVGVGGRQHRDGPGGVHRRVPGHVGHVEKQHVDRVGIAGTRRWRSPCASCRGPTSGASQEKALSMRFGRPSASISRSSGPRGIAELRAVERLAGAECTLAVRRRMGGDRLGVGRLEAEAARASRRRRAAPAADAAPGSLEAVEWAEMPRIAWNATGRPIIVRGARRAVGPGPLERDRLSKATRRARRRGGG